MTEMEYLVSEINKHLQSAPETSYTKEKGRTFSERNLVPFLYFHALEDITFDNYVLVQIADKGLVGKLLDDALSALDCVEGSQCDGEDIFEFMKMNTAIEATRLVMKFECRYPERAIRNELKHGDESRWVNVKDLHQQLLNILQGEDQ